MVVDITTAQFPRSHLNSHPSPIYSQKKAITNFVYFIHVQLLGLICTSYNVVLFDCCDSALTHGYTMNVVRNSVDNLVYNVNANRHIHTL